MKKKFSGRLARWVNSGSISSRQAELILEENHKTKAPIANIAKRITGKTPSVKKKKSKKYRPKGTAKNVPRPSPHDLDSAAPLKGSTTWDEGHGEDYQTRCQECGSDKLYHACPNK